MNAAEHKTAPADTRSPSYDALLIIAQSVTGALARAGLTDCDDPGEAIDVIRERYERRIAELVAAATEMLRVERTQGVTDEEAEAAIERLDAALADERKAQQ